MVVHAESFPPHIVVTADLTVMYFVSVVSPPVSVMMEAVDANTGATTEVTLCRDMSCVLCFHFIEACEEKECYQVTSAQLLTCPHQCLPVVTCTQVDLNVRVCCSPIYIIVRH